MFLLRARSFLQFAFRFGSGTASARTTRNSLDQRTSDDLQTTCIRLVEMRMDPSSPHTSLSRLSREHSPNSRISFPCGLAIETPGHRSSPYGLAENRPYPHNGPVDPGYNTVAVALGQSPTLSGLPNLGRSDSVGIGSLCSISCGRDRRLKEQTQNANGHLPFAWLAHLARLWRSSHSGVNRAPD